MLVFIASEALMSHSVHPYAQLNQDSVLNAVEALGFYSDGRVFPLNSYENRVYQIGLEDHQPIIAKFYRPHRWSRACIQEELDFLHELAEDELPVVAPLCVDGQSLFDYQGFYFALFPRRAGHAPELGNAEELTLLGRHLARLHQAGSRRPFRHRPTLQGAADMRLASQQVLASPFLASDFAPNYEHISRELTERVAELWHHEQTLRLHGDLHIGNLLLRDETLYLVDFDDCLQGPAMQDIWLLLSGDAEERQRELHNLAEGYELFRPFPWQEIGQIELLRSVRLMKHAAWLATRWEDPAFPQAFPWFASPSFWAQHLSDLREQLTLIS